MELQIERALSTAEIGRTSAGFTAAIRSLKGGSQRKIDAKVGLSPQKLAALYLLAAIDNCSLSEEISQAIDFRLNSRRGFWQPAITRALLRTEAPQEGAKKASPPAGAPPGAAGRAPERAPAAQTTTTGQEGVAATDNLWSIRYRLGLAHEKGEHQEQFVGECIACQRSTKEAGRSRGESRDHLRAEHQFTGHLDGYVDGCQDCENVAAVVAEVQASKAPPSDDDHVKAGAGLSGEESKAEDDDDLGF